MFKVFKKMSNRDEGSNSDNCNDRGIANDGCICEWEYGISKQSSCNHNPRSDATKIQIHNHNHQF